MLLKMMNNYKKLKLNKKNQKVMPNHKILRLKENLILYLKRRKQQKEKIVLTQSIPNLTIKSKNDYITFL